MTAALEGGEWSAARPGRTLHPVKTPVPILQEAGWAPGSVWTGGKFRPNRDSISDRSARSQSLYRLRYPSHIEKNIQTWKAGTGIRRKLHCSTLKKMARCSWRLVPIYQTTGRNVPEDRNVHNRINTYTIHIIWTKLESWTPWWVGRIRHQSSHKNIHYRRTLSDTPPSSTSPDFRTLLKTLNVHLHKQHSY